MVMSGFDPIRFCVAVEKYRITAVLIVPPVLLAIARHPGVYNPQLLLGLD